MQRASHFFPLADREGAIDIKGHFMFNSVIACSIKRSKSYFAVEVRKM